MDAVEHRISHLLCRCIVHGELIAPLLSPGDDGVFIQYGELAIAPQELAIHHGFGDLRAGSVHRHERKQGSCIEREQAGIAGQIDGLCSGIALSTASDIAIRSDGTAILANATTFYEIDLGTGELTELFSDLSAAHAGLAFDPLASTSLLTFEVNGTDDLYSFDTSLAAPPRINVLQNIIPQFNAGRGDLASLTLGDTSVPEPNTLMLLGLGIAALRLRRRRRETSAP